MKDDPQCCREHGHPACPVQRLGEDLAAGRVLRPLQVILEKQAPDARLAQLAAAAHRDAGVAEERASARLAYHLRPMRKGGVLRLPEVELWRNLRRRASQPSPARG